VSAELPLFGQPQADRIETVTEFTRRVKTLVEGGIRPGWIRGEVSNLRAQTSGHLYFSLKDAGAQLSAVLFRADAARQSVRLRDGLQVVVYGEINVYEARGQYQAIVRVVVEDGVGRLQREFEALKQRLAAEGLFAAERKRPIPFLPPSDSSPLRRARRFGIFCASWSGAAGAAGSSFFRLEFRAREPPPRWPRCWSWRPASAYSSSSSSAGAEAAWKTYGLSTRSRWFERSQPAQSRLYRRLDMRSTSRFAISPPTCVQKLRARPPS